MIKEVNRDLLVQGISVKVKHYQNKKLFGDNQITKELIGVSFLISKPLKGRIEMLKFIFKEDADRIKKYCQREHKDRISGQPLNPGNSYLIRSDMWHKFLVGGDKKFDYTYAERTYNKLQLIKEILKEDKHSRQAVMQIFHPSDLKKAGKNTRIPCSLSFSFLIRNNRMHLIYNMRSNDYFSHMCIDIFLAAELNKWMTEQINKFYPEVKPGPLIYFANSLHAYKWSLNKVVVF